jgi:hypothetical protein
MTKLRTILATTAVLPCIGALLSGCGGTQTASASSQTAITSTSSGCTLADVSGSTADVRTAYTGAFARFATAIGTQGDGHICLIVAAGNPLSESEPMNAFVGPTAAHRNSPDYAPGEIQANVEAASKNVLALLEHPPVRAGGSALIEAAVVAGMVLKPGDWLQFLSDGIENSSTVGDFHSLDLSAAGIQRLLNRLATEGLLAHLAGVRVEMPLLLYHPGGLRMDAERQIQIADFWQAWAKRCGATLAPVGAAF